MSLKDLEARQWMTNLDVRIGDLGRVIKEALNGKAIAIFKSSSEFIIVEIKEDGSQGRAVTSLLPTIKLLQIEVGGLQGDILIGLDYGEKKELVSCKIKNDLTIEVVGRFSLSSLMSEGDSASPMAITPCSEYVFVQTRNNSYQTLKQLIFSVNGSKIGLCAVLDLSSENLKLSGNALAYLKTVGDELIFKRLCGAWKPPTTLLTFTYNKRTNEFNELKTHRKTVEDTTFVKLARQGNTLYTIGSVTSKLITIT